MEYDYTRVGMYRRRIEIHQTHSEEHLIYYTPWVRHDDSNLKTKLDRMERYLVNFGWRYVDASLIAIGTEFREYLG